MLRELTEPGLYEGMCHMFILQTKHGGFKMSACFSLLLSLRVTSEKTKEKTWLWILEAQGAKCPCQIFRAFLLLRPKNSSMCYFMAFVSWFYQNYGYC